MLSSLVWVLHASLQLGVVLVLVKSSHSCWLWVVRVFLGSPCGTAIMSPLILCSLHSGQGPCLPPSCDNGTVWGCA